MSKISTYFLATLPALVVLGFFVWFANWIPQTRWEPPEKQDISAGMTPTELAGFGQTIVRQRGCLACHTIEPAAGVKGQGRGPNLANIAARRLQGVAGGQGTQIDYLVEALYRPDAFLVEGYTAIMPTSTKAPAKLSYEEVVAVVNYLQTLGGTPSVKVGDIPRPSAQLTTSVTAPDPALVATDVATIMEEFMCLDCHSMVPGEVILGPPFEAARFRQAASLMGQSNAFYIMQSIVDPRAAEPAEFPAEVMPDDYGEQLSAGQLQTIVTYLLALED